MDVSPVLWVSFFVIAPTLLAIEIFVLPRGNPLPLRTAVISSVVCLLVGLSFGMVVGSVRGLRAGPPAGFGDGLTGDEELSPVAE